MTLDIACVLALISATVVMVLLYLKVLPKKMNGNLNNKYLQWIHDYFKFKKLYIEEILRFLFVLSTVVCVCFGIFMLFAYEKGYYGNNSCSIVGIYFLIIGTVVLRIIYELVMLKILSVKNMIDINAKLDELLAERKAVTEDKANTEQEIAAGMEHIDDSKME